MSTPRSGFDRLSSLGHARACAPDGGRPQVQRLELEVPISLGANHDSGVARILGAYYQPIAPTSDGRAADAGHGQGQGAPTEMRTQRLTSTVVPSKTHYVIGVCKDGASGRTWPGRPRAD